MGDTSQRLAKGRRLAIPTRVISMALDFLNKKKFRWWNA
jgi:hypothetical protein